MRHSPKSMWVTVKELIDVTDSTFLIRLEPDGGVFGFHPGQFISLIVDKDGKTISRPYSIASPPEQRDFIELCVRKVPGGFMSNYLTNLKPGDQMRARAPLGRFVLIEPIRNDIVFTATGTGLAPFISMIGHIFRTGSDVDKDREFWLIIGFRYIKDRLYLDYLQGLTERNPNLHVIFTISRPEDPDWKGRIGYVQKVIKEEIRDPKDKHIYICGLRGMVEETKRLGEEMGFGLIRFEKWD